VAVKIHRYFTKNIHIGYRLVAKMYPTFRVKVQTFFIS